ncbi:MAG: protealysin inhibitor emfourin [Acidimicrobiales bacterium]
MGTRLRLTRSGGFAGLSMVAYVDLDDLPERTAAEVRAALEKVNFDTPRKRSGGRRMPGQPDAFQYDLIVNDDKKRSVTAHEPLSDPGLQKLSQVLLPFARPE